MDLSPDELSIVWSWEIDGQPKLEPPVGYPRHPELTYRLNGTWNGWLDYLGEEIVDEEWAECVDEMESNAFTYFCHKHNIQLPYQFPSIDFAELRKSCGYFCEGNTEEAIIETWIVCKNGKRFILPSSEEDSIHYDYLESFNYHHGEHADSVIPEIYLRLEGNWPGWARYLRIPETPEIRSRDALEQRAFDSFKQQDGISLHLVERIKRTIHDWQHFGADYSKSPLKYKHPEFIGRLKGTWCGWTAISPVLATEAMHRQDLYEDFICNLLASEMHCGERDPMKFFDWYFDSDLADELLYEWNMAFKAALYQDASLPLSLFLWFFGLSLCEHAEELPTLRDFFIDALAEFVYPVFQVQNTLPDIDSFLDTREYDTAEVLLTAWEQGGPEKFISLEKRLDGSWVSWQDYYRLSCDEKTFVDAQNKLEDATFYAYCENRGITAPFPEEKIMEVVTEWQNYDQDEDEGPLPQHPELVFRLSGDWQGWSDFIGADDEVPIESRYADKLEDAAFELYCELMDIENPYR